MTEQTILLGLDGATFTILDPLMAEGQMPRLRRLVEGGARAVLRSTTHPLTPPAWTSLMTGRTPGAHGVLDFYRPEAADARVLTITTARDVRTETIWSIANRHGLAATSLNFPMMSPPRPIEGTLIPGWVPWRHLKLTSRPQGLFERLKAIPDFDPRSLTVDLVEEGRALEGMPAEDAVEWVRSHVRRERLWSAITQLVLRETPTPLAAILFDGTDKIQHLCYRLLDPALYGAGLSEQDAHIREEALVYYRELDRFIGEICDQAGPEARVFIASDHGFGPWTHVFYLNAWLQQHGYLAWTPRADAGASGDLGLDTPRRQAILMDWSRTAAYGVSVSGNGIRIRRAGGDPGEGGVAPEDYEPLRRKLTAALLDVRDPETGERVVRDVLPREAIYAGEAMAHAPDLTVLLRDYGFVSLLNSDVVVRKRPAPFGTHHPDGIFIAAGPGIRRGAAIEPRAIVDVAPTLLYSLGAPIPENLEGALPERIFSDDFLRARPPRRGPATLPQAAFAGAEKVALTREDEAEITGRLRALGYVE